MSVFSLYAEVYRACVLCRVPELVFLLVWSQQPRRRVRLRSSLSAAQLPCPPDPLVLSLALIAGISRMAYCFAGLYLPFRWSSLGALLAALSYASLFALSNLTAIMSLGVLRYHQARQAGHITEEVMQQVTRVYPAVQRPLPRSWWTLNLLISGPLLLCFLAATGSDIAMHHLRDRVPLDPTPSLLARPQMCAAHRSMDWATHPAWAQPLSSREALECPAHTLPLITSDAVLGPLAGRALHMEQEADAAVGGVAGSRVQAFIESLRVPPLPPVGLLRTPPADTADAAAVASTQATLKLLGSIRGYASTLGSICLTLSFLAMGMTHLLLDIMRSDAETRWHPIVLPVQEPAQDQDPQAVQAVQGGAASDVGDIAAAAAGALPPRDVHLYPVSLNSSVSMLASACALLSVINLVSLLAPGWFFRRLPFLYCQTTFFLAETLVPFLLATMCCFDREESGPSRLRRGAGMAAYAAPAA